MKDNNIKEDKKDNKKPDERGGLDITTHIRIFDPETNEVFVSKRGED